LFLTVHRYTERKKKNGKKGEGAGNTREVDYHSWVVWRICFYDRKKRRDPEQFPAGGGQSDYCQKTLGKGESTLRRKSPIGKRKKNRRILQEMNRGRKGWEESPGEEEDLVRKKFLLPRRGALSENTRKLTIVLFPSQRVQKEKSTRRK